MESIEMLYFKLFRGVCAKINESLELNKILMLITKEATKMLDAKGCAIYLLDKNENRLIIGSYYGLSGTYINKGPVDADKSIMACMKGETVFLPVDDPRIQYPEAARNEGIASILSVPMKVKGSTIGVLRLYTTESWALEDIEMEFAAGLADISAIAIENARMVSHLKSDYENLISDVHQWFDYGVRT